MMVRSDHPTVPPTFDVVQYAKDSDARLQASPSVLDPSIPRPPLTPTSETRLVTRPTAYDVEGDAAWFATLAGRVPYVALGAEDLKRLPLDHRSGFLLSRTDGQTEVQLLVELSAMPREEAVYLLRNLADNGIIAFR